MPWPSNHAVVLPGKYLIVNEDNTRGLGAGSSLSSMKDMIVVGQGNIYGIGATNTSPYFLFPFYLHLPTLHLAFLVNHLLFGGWG